VANKLLLFVAIGFTVFITVINFIHLKSIPELGSDYDDKIYHVGVYMVFSFLWVLWSVIKFKSPRLLSRVLLSCLAYGILLEVFQQIINPSRTFDIFDLLANCAGVLFGTVIVVLWNNKTLN
jgi:VanZ family protein